VQETFPTLFFYYIYWTKKYFAI